MGVIVGRWTGTFVGVPVGLQWGVLSVKTLELCSEALKALSMAEQTVNMYNFLD